MSEARPAPWGCIVVTGGLLLTITAFVCSGAGWMVGTSMTPDEPVQEVGSFDPGDEFVAISVKEMYADPWTGGVTLELQTADGRVLPMIIGTAEADAIDRVIQGVPVPRPMTHDLFGQLLDGVQARLVAVTIRKLRDNAFHAALYVERADGEVVMVDSRSSDAIALGLRATAPIYAHEDVLAAAAQ